MVKKYFVTKTKYFWNEVIYTFHFSGHGACIYNILTKMLVYKAYYKIGYKDSNGDKDTHISC